MRFKQYHHVYNDNSDCIYDSNPRSNIVLRIIAVFKLCCLWCCVISLHLIFIILPQLMGMWRGYVNASCPLCTCLHLVCTSFKCTIILGFLLFVCMSIMKELSSRSKGCSYMKFCISNLWMWKSLRLCKREVIIVSVKTRFPLQLVLQIQKPTTTTTAIKKTAHHRKICPWHKYLSPQDLWLKL
jgi:hypothetical protein